MSEGTVSLRLQDVMKRFGDSETQVEVLKGVSLNLDGGDAAVITGPSGSGKSTLLHIIGTLDTPTGGKIEINGKDPGTLEEKDLARFRNHTIGFVFQDHHLLPQYSVLENVLLPTMAFANEDRQPAVRARDLLDRVGLSHRLKHRPAELSGGERQRVAIARAMINQPAILLCDEPTGNLDGKTADTVADLFFKLHEEEHNILIAVTHSMGLADRFKLRYELQEGRCVEA